MDIESCNVDTARFRDLVVIDGEFQMIVQVELVVGEASVRRWGFETDRESSDGVIQFLAPHQHWQTVEGDMDTVLPLHKFLQPPNLLGFDGCLAEWGTPVVGLDLHNVRRRFQFQALESSSQVLSLTTFPYRCHFRDRTTW